MAAVIPLKNSKAREGKEVAKPYEPTAREAEALAVYEKRKAKQIPAPGMKVAMSEQDGTTHAKIEVDHADIDVGYNLLSGAIGSENRDFLIGTIDSLAMVARNGGTIDQGKMNYALAFVKGLHLADQLEATLGVQMAAIHLATMKAAPSSRAQGRSR
jgi:hypothetical protein